MKPGTVVRLALAGTRTDTLRVVLTAVSATPAIVALLAALTVLSIPTPGGDGSESWSQQYSNPLLREPGLRPGVALALLLLAVPVLALAGQCARLGAPARHRRLASIRLAGATPRQALLIVAAETGLASALGTGAGLAVFLFGRRILHRPDLDGRLPLPTDVLPSTGVLIAACVALPLVAAAVATLLLRRVTIGPLGVERRAPRTLGPRPWPGLLIVLGVVLFVGFGPLLAWFETAGWHIPSFLGTLTLFAGALLAALGVVLGAGWISFATGRLLHRLSGRPAALLAARRLVADPWTGSRTLGALLASAVVGGGAVGFRAHISTMLQARAQSQRRYDEATGQDPHHPDVDSFYLDTMDLVDLAVAVAVLIAVGGLLVAVAESIVARRRTYAALVASGVPRPVLARSVVWQALLPAVPAVVLAALTGLVLIWALLGRTVSEGGGSSCSAPGDECSDPVASVPYTVTFEPIVRTVPVPLDHLAVLCVGALLAVLAAVGVGLLFLRPSTDLEEVRAT